MRWSPPDAPELSVDVAVVCGELEAGLRLTLGDALSSLYLYGAVAFPRPPRWSLDVDFHALLRRPLTDTDRDAIRALHQQLAESSELGKELDGYYILISDATKPEPPISQVSIIPSTTGVLTAHSTDDAWALHRAHVLAGRFLLLFGDDPRDLLAPPTWDELARALDAEMTYIEAHPEHAAFGVLNACRILYSVRSRNVVVAKYAAAQWAMAELPGEWRDTIAAAVRLYAQAARTSDRDLVKQRRTDLVQYIKEELHR